MRMRYYTILSVVLIIAVLTYLIIFNSGNYITGKAAISEPFSINAWDIKTGEIILQIENTEKEDYIIQSVSVENCGSYNTPTNVESGTKITFIINCEKALTENSFNGNIIITYRKISGSVDLTSKGEIAGRVKEE